MIVASAEVIGITVSEIPGYGEEHDNHAVVSPIPAGDHRRRYAGIEALKIGLGGIAYIAPVLGMSQANERRDRELKAIGEDGGGPPRRPSGDAIAFADPAAGGRRPSSARRA